MMSSPIVSIIIPSRDGSRNGNVQKLLGDIANQTYKEIEIILVIGASPNGHARNIGVKSANGEFLFMLDDDLRLGNKFVVENLMTFLKQDGSYGMVGCSQQIPPDANNFQIRAAAELPRSEFPVVQEPTDTDMVNHCAGFVIHANLYKEVGGESDILRRGTDPDLRNRVKKAGYRVLVAPKTWSYHPLPDNWKKFWSYHKQNAKETAYVFLYHKSSIVDISYDEKPVTKPDRQTWWRVIRYAWRFIKALITCRWLLVFSYTAYTAGFLEGIFFPIHAEIKDGKTVIYSAKDLNKYILNGTISNAR